MAGHRAYELVALEREKLDVALRADRRCPRHVPQQRDLSEVAARTGDGHDLAVRDDLHLALRDDVEAVAHFALPEDLTRGLDADGRQGAREALQHGWRQGLEDFEPAQERELALGDRHLIERSQAAMAEDREHRQERTGDDQGAPPAESLDQERGHDRPDSDPPDPE